MTQALNFDRAARPFGHSPVTVPQRPATPTKPLAVVPAAVVPAAAPVPVREAALDGMIRSIGQATSRMAELLEQLHEQERIIGELQGSNETLRDRAETAETSARLHEIRAGEALLKVEQLQAQKQLNSDEHERLKASVDTLLAMFGGEDQFALAANPA